MNFPDDLLHLVRTDEPLGPLVWLGIGGPARYFAEPVEPDDVQKLIRAANESDLPVRILGVEAICWYVNQDLMVWSFPCRVRQRVGSKLPETK